jgi:hypothetical protein
VLPTLTVNRHFMRAFLAADTPCFALGMLEERGRQYGLLALRPDEEIPAEVSDRGFSFGHALFGSAAFEVLHFALAFYGFQTYNVLINPNHPLVQAVLERMLADGEYFFFALGASGRVTTFRTGIGQDTLSQVQANLARIQRSTTTEAQYHRALAAFADNPEPEGILLHWVCRETLDALDLTTDRLDLTSA